MRLVHRLRSNQRFWAGSLVCELLRIDPAVYFTETDPMKNAVRDAAATVIASNRARQQEEAERRRKS